MRIYAVYSLKEVTIYAMSDVVMFDENKTVESRVQTEEIEKCSQFEVKGGQLENSANCRLGPWSQLVPNKRNIFVPDLQVNL